MRKRQAIFTLLRIGVTAGLLYLVFSGINFSDSLVLRKDERQIEGRVLNWREVKDEEDKVIRFEEDGGAVKDIPVDDVLPDATVQLEDGTMKSGRLMADNAEQVELKNSDGGREIIWKNSPDKNPPVKDISVSYFSRGFLSIVKSITPGLFVLGFLLYGVINLTGVVRWIMLMRVQKIMVSFWYAVKLTFLGFFFNNVMPGLTGGDAAKAYYAARSTDKKAGAVIAVFIDRIIGIVCLALLSGGAILLNLGDLRFRGAALTVAVFMGVVCLIALVLFSHRMRRIIPITKLIKKIPLQGLQRILKEADQAIFIYRYHKKTVLLAIILSLIGHSFMISGSFVYARAIGVTVLSYDESFVFLPVIFMIMAIPISLAGWGIGEASFSRLLSVARVPLSEGTTMGVLYNITRTLWSLPGAIVVLTLGKKPSAEEIERELKVDIDKGPEDTASDSTRNV